MSLKRRRDQAKETIKTIESINLDLDDSLSKNHSERGESQNTNLDDTLAPLKRTGLGSQTNSLSVNLPAPKPQKADQSYQDRQDEILYEVAFAEDAPVAESFQSALKCWRIFQPNVISVEKQELSDQHIDKLCEFLQHKDMIIRLNVRRNKISNEGAKRLAKLIKEEDNALTHLDIERNRVGSDGGAALLDALSTTTRIVSCNIVYGNPISNKMGRVFEREIKANA